MTEGRRHAASVARIEALFQSRRCFSQRIGRETPAHARLESHGPDSLAEPEGQLGPGLLLRATLNLLVLLLGVLGASSLATGDVAGAAIMAAMLVRGGWID